MKNISRRQAIMQVAAEDAAAAPYADAFMQNINREEARRRAGSSLKAAAAQMKLSKPL